MTTGIVIWHTWISRRNFALVKVKEPLVRQNNRHKSKSRNRKPTTRRPPAAKSKRTRRVKPTPPPPMPLFMADNLLTIYGCFGRDRVQVDPQARIVMLDWTHDLSWLVFLEPMLESFGGEPRPPYTPAEIVETMGNILPDDVRWLNSPSEDAELVASGDLRHEWMRWQVVHGEIAPGYGLPNPVWPRVTRVLAEAA